MEVTPPSIDMGVTLPRTPQHGSAELKNTGDKPLRILAVTPSCKCTTTNDLAGKIVPPGESISLTAELEGVAMPQTQRAVLRILVEGYGKILEVPIRGETAMPIRSNPPLINAVTGQPRSGRFVIESVDTKPFTICAVGGRKPEYLGFDPAVDAPRAVYLLKYDLDSWSPTYPAYLVVETDRPECPVFDVWIRTETTIPKPGFKMKDYRLNVGRVDQGGSMDTAIEFEDFGDPVLAVESVSPTVGVELLDQTVSQVGESRTRKVNLRITPRSTQGGMFYTQLKLYTREKEQIMVAFGTARPKDAAGCTGCTTVDAPVAAAASTPAPDKAPTGTATPASR
jgi:hypothetical protein